MNDIKPHRAEARSAAQARVGLAPLYWLLLGGLILRLFFVENQGFASDVGTFENWALTLAGHPLSRFYAIAGFADYPPGYFYVLALIGHVYAPFAAHDSGYAILRALVKLPAIFMDLVDGAIVYALVRRFAGAGWALGAAALLVFNPAAIFISASWGQVDSISAGLALLAIYLLLRSDDAPVDRFSLPIVLAWLCFAASMLVKPQAAIIAPLMIAFAFVDPTRRRQRLIGSGIGIVAGLALALVAALPFHPTANLGGAYAWLYQRYEFAKDVYPYNSVNAFNLWSIRYAFWTPDSTAPIGALNFPEYAWGLLLAVAATILVLFRYVRQPSARALVEGCAILTLAFFMFSTRMHERYVFDGVVFTIACIAFAQRYLWSAVILSLTLLVNLFYSLTYYYAMTQHWAVNGRDMWPAVTHPLSLLNVAVFFYLAYTFLGQESTMPDRTAAKPASAEGAAALAWLGRARQWFDPREGLQRLVWPLDYALAAATGIISFVVSYVNYWFPPGKIFDEIYFARAGEEYLKHVYIYENTHPPLTKLIITFSIWLFGGLAHGDNAHGWRFLDVLFGAIVVVVLYAFAKRVTRSSLFATVAALMLVCGGMHFVQSRIATPEGIVVAFSLATLYAFYRFWLASQATVRAWQPSNGMRIAVSAVVAWIVGFGLSAAINVPLHQSRAAYIVTGLYFMIGLYLLMRLVIIPRVMRNDGELVSYPEGSFAVRGGSAPQQVAADGTVISGRKQYEIRPGEARISYGANLAVKYATPDGSAQYAPGIVETDAGERQEGRHATPWLITFTVLLGMLVASKWYGVMAYGVSFVVVMLVWLQRYLRPAQPKRWGNPLGFRLDIALATILFVSASVYVATYIPQFHRQIEIHNLSDMVYRQYSMYEYHATLRATHPYQSRFWKWPLDLRPILYYASYTKTTAAVIYNLPNPLIIWFGLLTVPWVGYLAWRERNKGYALIVLAYLLQWLPWALSPRITFDYHFYVDIPLICLCNVVVLQRILRWGRENRESEVYAKVGVCAYLVAVALAFVWFYPIYTGIPLTWAGRSARMWLGSWI